MFDAEGFSWKSNFAGLGISGFRSYGTTAIQRFGPMEPLHLIAGQNNSGKSNALRLFTELLPELRVPRSQVGALLQKAEAIPTGWTTSQHAVISLGLKVTGPFAESFFGSDHRARKLLESFFLHPLFEHDDPGTVWLDYDLGSQSKGSSRSLIKTPFKERLALDPTMELARGLDRYVPAMSVRATVGERIHAHVQNIELFSQLPNVSFIEASRKLTSDSSKEDPIEVRARNGAGMVQGLARLKHPDSNRRSVDIPRFDAIQKFVRDVLEDPGAQLDTNQAATEIFVKVGEHERQLADLGSGIEQLILIAISATLAQDSLIVIEEPESFLHPTLQRRLVTYLRHETNNHYVASTHSAHILNATEASISHVELHQGNTVVRGAGFPQARATLVSDLGYRASDLVQSNFVVWVEGPSDRTYVRQWLLERDDRLVEGSHYSLMFYGGGLLNSLGFDDPEIDEFINMNALNRNAAILIDSDLGPGKSELSATKTRVIDELEKNSLMSWVTAGYTIENYVHPELLRSAVELVYPGHTLTGKLHRQTSPLRKKTVSDRESAPSKTLVARAVVELAHMPDSPWSDSPWLLDVEEQSQALAIKIASVNGLGPI